MPCSLTVLDFYCHCHCYCYYYYYHYYYYLHYYYYPASKNDLSITQEDTAASEKPQNGFDLSFRPRSCDHLFWRDKELLQATYWHWDNR